MTQVACMGMGLNYMILTNQTNRPNLRKTEVLREAGCVSNQNYANYAILTVNTSAPNGRNLLHLSWENLLPVSGYIELLGHLPSI